MSGDLIERLRGRAKMAGVDLPSSVEDRLQAYLRLLARWNARINLTALHLDPPDEAALDRLAIEPIAASAFVPEEALGWMDFGSGCGSPAVPLKLVRPAAQLTMVEAAARKAAFLREAARSLGLTDTVVLTTRFEELAAGGQHAADVVTVRAVRPTDELFRAAALLLRSGGALLLFTVASPGEDGRPEAGEEFDLEIDGHLLTAASSLLVWRRR